MLAQIAARTSGEGQNFLELIVQFACNGWRLDQYNNSNKK